MDAPCKRTKKTIRIYLAPALVDLLLSLVIFVGTVRAAHSGGNTTRVGAVLAVWSFIYILTCLLIGRRVASHNARRFVQVGCLLLALSCALLTVAVNYLPMLLLMGLVGVATALFFLPFQVLMKDVDTADGRPLTYSVGLYTFSWSLGFAIGPMVAGLLMQLGAPPAGGGEGPGWRYAFIFGTTVALAISAVLGIVFRRPPEPTAAIAPPDPTSPSCYRGRPNFAWLGWLGAAAGVMALSINRSVFAARAVNELHLADSIIGTILCVLSIAQALTGLALIDSRTWMYRPVPVALFALPGILGLLCVGFGQHLSILLIGAALFGVYSGAFFFYLVFHSLVLPSRASQSVAINEIVVGIASFAGPLIGGLMADRWGICAPFIAAAGLCLLVAAVQASVHAQQKF